MSFIHLTFRWLLPVFCLCVCFFFYYYRLQHSELPFPHLLVAQTLVSSEPIPRRGMARAILESEESEVGGSSLHSHQQ